MNLYLPLKEKWFEMTKIGIKTEDYREINPYWCNRLLMFRGESQSRQWWYNEFFDPANPLTESVKNILRFSELKPFHTNILTLGYPKSTDTDRILKFEHKGIDIRTGNPNWGAEPGKLYFVVLHGSFLNEL